VFSQSLPLNAEDVFHRIRWISFGAQIAVLLLIGGMAACFGQWMQWSAGGQGLFSVAVTFLTLLGLFSQPLQPFSLALPLRRVERLCWAAALYLPPVRRALRDSLPATLEIDPSAETLIRLHVVWAMLASTRRGGLSWFIDAADAWTQAEQAVSGGLTSSEGTTRDMANMWLRVLVTVLHREGALLSTPHGTRVFRLAMLHPDKEVRVWAIRLCQTPKPVGSTAVLGAGAITL